MPHRHGRRVPQQQGEVKLRPGDRAARRPWLIAVACLACGLALTTVAVEGVHRAREQQGRSEFERRADTLQSEVVRQLGLLESALKGARSAHSVAGALDDAKLHTLMRSLDLDRVDTGLMGMGMVERVQQAGGGNAFVLRGVQPVPRDRDAPGMDLAAVSVSREVIEAATDNGMATLSGPLWLAQDPGHRLGWIMLQPFYRGRPDTPEQRRADMAGFAYAAAVADDLLAPVSELLGNAVRYRVYDGTPAQGVLLYDSQPNLPPAQALHTRRSIMVGNRVLTLKFEATPALQAPAGAFIPAAVAAGGTVLSLLLALSAWLLLSGRRRVLALAERMTQDLRRMAFIVERSEGGAFTGDAQGRITWTNRGFLQLVGRSEDVVQGLSMAQLMGEATDLPSGQLSAIGRELLAGRNVRMEVQGRRPDGSVFWADLDAQSMFAQDGSVCGYVGIALDISERKRAELRIKASEHLLRLITDNIPARLSYWDSSLRCRFANRTYRESIAAAGDILDGRELTAALVGDSAFEQMRPHFEQVLQGVPQQFEQNEQVAGQRTTWLVHCVPDRVDGKIHGLFAVANDVTELRRARDAALTASQAKTRFLSAMSHEIRTPMNAIMGMLRLLQDSGLDGRQKDYASKAAGATRSLLSLINDVLDLSKIEAGKMALDCRPFELENLLAEVSAVLAASVGDKDLEVVYDIDPQLPRRLVGDELRLRQIVLNLAANAVKFTAAGEVVVQCKQVEALPGAARLQLAVRDTGPGISREEQHLLFEDYAQASGSIARQFGGTGLGLGICRRLAALMGSELRLDSSPGEGSRFWLELTLPVAEGPTPAPASPAAIERILVVDDNACARESLATMARAQGWQAEVAVSAEEALGRLRAAAQPYDAILVDWRMPGQDSWATCLRLRTLAATARTALLAMGTALERETLSQCPVHEQALLDGFIVKPVAPSLLREALVLAAARGASQAPSPVPAAPTDELTGLRLLLAEDNAMNQHIACELLGRHGARLEVVADGAAAVARLRAGERYDLVLMDVQMPVMDGLSATRCIRNELGLRELPIVAMTANALASDRTECLQAGMDDHVSKPFVLEELVATILRQARPRPGAKACTPRQRARAAAPQ